MQAAVFLTRRMTPPEFPVPSPTPTPLCRPPDSRDLLVSSYCRTQGARRLTPHPPCPRGVDHCGLSGAVLRSAAWAAGHRGRAPGAADPRVLPDALSYTLTPCLLQSGPLKLGNGLPKVTASSTSQRHKARPCDAKCRALAPSKVQTPECRATPSWAGGRAGCRLWISFRQWGQWGTPGAASTLRGNRRGQKEAQDYKAGMRINKLQTLRAAP